MPLALRIALVWMLAAPAVFAQSLGDVARQNRENKTAQDQTAPAPKVITNSDLAGEADAPPDTASTSEKDARANQNAARRSAQQRAAEQRTAAQWKQQILAQKSRITFLQGQIDELKGKITASFGTVQYEAPYSRAQARHMQRLTQLQHQLEEQQTRLADMQEAARKAGMHTPVYDP